MSLWDFTILSIMPAVRNVWLAVSFPTLLLLAGTARAGREISMQTSREFSLQPPPRTEDGEGCRQSGPSPSLYTQANRLSLSHKTIWINPPER